MSELEDRFREDKAQGRGSMAESFNYAFQGIVHVLRNERNMKVHFALGFGVLFVALFMKLNPVSIALVFTAITLVIGAELMNSAIEHAINTFTTNYDPAAKLAKDAAAGAVLVAAVNSVIIGYLLVVNQGKFELTVIQKMMHFPAHITFIVILMTSFAVIAIKAMGRAEDLVRGGMPSGHAAVAFAVATSIFFISHSTLIAGLTLFLAILVSQSRVQARIHSTSEVIVGAILGSLVALLVFQLLSAG